MFEDLSPIGNFQTMFFGVLSLGWSGGPILSGTFGPEFESEDESIMTNVEQTRKCSRI